MEYTLRWIRPTKSTNVDITKLNKVNSVAKKYENPQYEEDPFQVYGSVERVQEFIQNFVEDCNADYSVDKVGVMRSNMTLEVKITLDPFTNNPIPVSICFDPRISEALSRDAKYLEDQLY